MRAEQQNQKLETPVQDDLVDLSEAQIASLRAKVIARAEQVRRELNNNVALGGCRRSPAADSNQPPPLSE